MVVQRWAGGDFNASSELRLVITKLVRIRVSSCSLHRHWISKMPYFWVVFVPIQNILQQNDDAGRQDETTETCDDVTVHRVCYDCRPT